MIPLMPPSDNKMPALLLPQVQKLNWRRLMDLGGHFRMSVLTE
jgi:hypothetical protein